MAAPSASSPFHVGNEFAVLFAVLALARGFTFLLFLIFRILSISLSPLSLVALSRLLQHGSGVRANMHPRISVFTTTALPVQRLSLLFLRTPIRLVLVAPLVLLALFLYP